ncbi:hypothetical protein [Streptacidiphilus sp. PAMC 29251]
MRLRYAGVLPTTFVTVGVEVDPGGEFEVPDDAAPGLLARADIEEMSAPSAPRRKAAKAPAADPDSTGSTPDPDVTEEVPGAGSDDH